MVRAVGVRAVVEEAPSHSWSPTSLAQTRPGTTRGCGDRGAVRSWQAMSVTQTSPVITVQPSDPELEEGPPSVAHIVKVAPGEDAQAKVLEARVTGTPVEALCGFVWVPSRDPRSLPLCQACKEVYDLYRMSNDGLRDRPGD